MSNDGVTEDGTGVSTTGCGCDSSGTSRTGGFLDRGHTGLLVVDDSLAVIGSNETAIELLRLGDDPVGSHVREVFSIGDEIATAIRDSFRTDSVVEFETIDDPEEPLEVRVTPNDGRNEVSIELRGIGDRIAMRQELQRSDRILETLDDGVYTLDGAFVITMVNNAILEMTGYEREELVGSHASMLAGSETLAMADEIIDQLRGDDSNIGMIESSICTADGERLPIETQFSTVEYRTGRQQRVGVVRDLTESRRDEQVLHELNRSARQFLRADTVRVVHETTVDLVTTVWPTASIAAYTFDEVASTLDLVASSGAFPDSHGPGDTVWEEFLTGEDGVTFRDVDASGITGLNGTDGSAREPNDAGARDPRSVQPELEEVEDRTRPSGRVIERSGGDSKSTRRTLYATLDEYGILHIELPDDENVKKIKDPVELLAANAVAALERVEQEATLARQSDALAEQNEKLGQLHELNDLIRRVNGALVDADTLTEIGDAVCELLVDAESVQFAWFGETYLTGGDPDPISEAGDGGGYLDDLGFTETDEGSDGVELANDAAELRAEPTYRALESGKRVVVDDVSTGLREAPWRERALVHGHRSIISIPLLYDELEYGAITLYADRRDAFDGEFGDLLGELGGTVADAINSIETRRSLRSESPVELKLSIEDPDTLLCRISSTLGEPISVDGTVSQGADRSLLYVATDGDLTSVPSEIRAVESVRRLDGDGSRRAELSVVGPTVVDRLATLGGNVDRLVGTPTGVEVTVTVPQSTGVRSFVEALGERYDAVELRSRRNRTARDESPTESTSVTEELTDRQFEAARTALLAGYFEWPRASTGEEVATAMGITQPTFNRHLRTTERNLFSALFEGVDDEE